MTEQISHTCIKLPELRVNISVQSLHNTGLVKIFKTRLLQCEVEHSEQNKPLTCSEEEYGKLTEDTNTKYILRLNT